MTRTDRLSDLLGITSRLIACMEREIDLLQEMRPHEIGALQVDKAALAAAYETHLQALNAEPDSNDDVSPALREDLIRATEAFQTVLAENARALRAVKAANDRVLKAIIDAVEQKRDRAAAYTATGAATGTGHKAASAALCMAVDQQL